MTEIVGVAGCLHTDLMDPVDAVLEQYRAIIDRVGWAVTMVAAAPEGDGGFAYTVGLTALGSPEFVIAGLPAGGLATGAAAATRP